jgi:hypothetical protein
MRIKFGVTNHEQRLMILSTRGLVILLLLTISVQLTHAATTDPVRVKTSFGLVQIDEDGQSLMVNDSTVFTRNSDSLHLLAYFKLRQEEVVLFIDACTGSSCGEPDDLYFLILKARAAPAILTADGFTTRGGNIEKAWREGDIVVVDLGYSKRAKLTSDKVTVSGGKRTLSVERKDCQTMYDLSKTYCSKKRAKQGAASSDCQVSTEDVTLISSNLSLAEMGYINGIIREHPGFQIARWRDTCVSWCNGKKVAPSDFARHVCSVAKP